MILQKSAPSLRRRLAAAHHLFADAALTDVDAELEQLTVDPWCTREESSRRILRIRCRTSREMIGRPGCPCRTFQVQKRRKPLRCQATTVSGSMIASAERQSLQMRKNHTILSGPRESISGEQFAGPRQFGGPVLGSPTGGQHANGRSKTELRKVS